MAEDSLNFLIELCEGDLRKSITYVQSLAYSKSGVDPNFIRNMTGRIDDEVVDDLLAACRSLDPDMVIAAVEQVRRQVNFILLL